MPVQKDSPPFPEGCGTANRAFPSENEGQGLPPRFGWEKKLKVSFTSQGQLLNSVICPSVFPSIHLQNDFCFFVSHTKGEWKQKELFLIDSRNFFKLNIIYKVSVLFKVLS